MATTLVVTRLEQGRGTTSVSLADGTSYTLPGDAAQLGMALHPGGSASFPDCLADQLWLLTADEQISAQVRALVIHRDVPFLARGVVLPDTPGLNSTRQGHAELAYAAVAEADLLLLLIPAHQALTDSLRQVIEEHLQLRPRGVAFCLTKIDRMTDDELNLVVDDTTCASCRGYWNGWLPASSISGGAGLLPA